MTPDPSRDSRQSRRAPGPNRERARGNQTGRASAPAGQQRTRPGDPRRTARRPKAARKAGSRIFLSILFVLILGLLTFATWKFMDMRDSDTKNAAYQSSDRSSGTGSKDHSEITKQLVLSSDPTLPLAGKLILLDPGHGGSDPGCVYPAAEPEYFEAELNLKLAVLTKSELEKKGATVILLREDDDWVSLYSRVALTHLYSLSYAGQTTGSPFSKEVTEDLTEKLTSVIDVNSDTIDSGGMGLMSGTGAGDDLRLLLDLERDIKDILYISIHCNSNEATSLHGTQVYYVTDDVIVESEDRLLIEDPSYADRSDFPIRDPYYGRDGDRNAFLAQEVYDAIVESASAMDTNTPQTIAQNFAVLREHCLTGILVETGFLSNSGDREHLTDPDMQQQIASGIASGCESFFAQENS